jgi:hypothetical protein
LLLALSIITVSVRSLLDIAKAYAAELLSAIFCWVEEGRSCWKAGNAVAIRRRKR